MAKSNDTVVEQLFEHLRKQYPNIEELADPVYWNTLERKQIEAAYKAGQRGNYINDQHYFFMEYVDND